MCLLAFQRKSDEDIPKEVFDKAWSFNPHGFGLGYLHKGKNSFITRKALNKDNAWEIYNETRRAEKYYAWLVIHWRFRTHGLVVEDNCHPFKAGKNVLLGHNGQIKIATNITYPTTWSDTRYFASILMENLPDKNLNIHDKVRNAPYIQEYLNGSRLVTIERGETVEDSQLIYWNFPEQEQEFKKYGMFSNYGWKAGIRSKPVITTTTPRGDTTNYIGRDSKNNRYMGLEVNRDLAPELPSVWWIVNELMDDPAQSYINMVDNFIRTWGRAPTGIEIQCAHDSIMEILNINEDDCDVREENPESDVDPMNLIPDSEIPANPNK